MTLKTFNIDEEVYKEFSKHCKKHGISMSKKIENFIREEIEKINGKRPLKPLTLPQTTKPVAVAQHSFSKYC